MKKAIFFLCGIVLFACAACAAPVDSPEVLPSKSPVSTPAPTPTPTAMPTPSPTPEPTPVAAADIADYTAKMERAREINPDVWGYICINGTSIDLPIMKQTPDYHYASHVWDDPNGEKEPENTDGSIYTFYNAPRQDRLYVVAGYNRPEHFHDLYHIYDYSTGKNTCEGGAPRCNIQSFTSPYPDLNTEDGRIWRLVLNGEESTWEVFSVFAEDSYQLSEGETPMDVLYDIMWFDKEDMLWLEDEEDFGSRKERSKEEIQEWIERQQARSAIEIDTEVPEDAELLTIYTDFTSWRVGAAFFLYRMDTQPAAE